MERFYLVEVSIMDKLLKVLNNFTDDGRWIEEGLGVWQEDDGYVGNGGAEDSSTAAIASEVEDSQPENTLGGGAEDSATAEIASEVEDSQPASGLNEIEDEPFRKLNRDVPF